MAYQDFKQSVLALAAKDEHVGDGQCVSLVVNNPAAYVENLFPGVSWPLIIQPLGANGKAEDIFAVANPAYFTKIGNDVTNPAQVPQPGDIMVFSHTPYPGYTNTFNNPYGHTGICDSADSTGYSLLQQNSPAPGNVANVTHYPWKFRHCIGWLRPVGSPSPAPAPAPTHLSLQINPGNWAVYTGDGKAAPRLPGVVQGGQKYGPVSIATNGWGIITFTGKTGHIEPAAFHMI